MDHKINWDCCGGVFAVPDAAVDKGLKLASGKAVKVLLYFMRHRAAPAAPEEIGVTAEDVEDALSYWESQGILIKADAPAPVMQAPLPAQKAETAEPVRIIAKPPEKPASAPKPVVSKPQKSLLPKEITERIESSDELKFLFRTSETYLKRALTFDDQRSILWFYDHLGMPADVITMLIACCCSIGSTSMGKIEKVAIDWHEKNIDTHEQAESEMLAMQKAFSFESEVGKRLKLPEKLTASQKKYISRWSAMDITLDMVELAYDRTVDTIGKPTFSYMDKIITKWYENGIKDTASAEQFDDRPKNGGSGGKSGKRAKSAPSKPPSYDLDLLFEHALNNTPTVKKKEED